MANEYVGLSKEYKDHTVPNAVNSLKIADLPFNAYDVHNQRIRNIDISIQVLDSDQETVIETVSGKCTSGSIRVQSDALIRRSLSLEVVFDEYFFPSTDSLFWFGRYYRVYVGIKDLSQTNHVVNFLLGTFIPEKSGIKINPTTSSISLELFDKMGEFDNSELENALHIPSGTPINQAIRLVMEDLGENRFGEMYESDETEIVPYTLEFGIGENKLDIIEKLRDMYMDYTCGYNVFGEFEFQKIEIQKETEYEDAKWIFYNDGIDGNDLTIEFSEDYNLHGVKNRVLVIGELNERTGIIPKAEVRITDAKNPINVDAIGTRTKVITDPKLVVDDQCFARARYEIWKVSNLQETISLESVPIYFLDVNDIIEVENTLTKKRSRYIIDDFTTGLGVEGKTSISAHKLYYSGLEYGEAFEPIVNIFMVGLNNYGWFSLGEERVKDCYNISASGSATMTVRFVKQQLGGMQASVTSYSTTKNQTLEIDLADWEGIDPTSEDGDSGRSAADYADRVIGHESFHAICNDYLGHDMMIQIPLWFKEGFAEFLHGVKDRYKTVMQGQTSANKRTNLTNIAIQQLNDEFGGTSEDYVASAIIAMAIYNLSGSRWNSLFINLRNQSNIGINFLYKLLPIGTDNDDVKAKVIAEIQSMNWVWTLLNNNDTDTLSVGGYHFMNLYGVRLNAKTVFNNANAITDSIGFNMKKA